MAHGLSGKPPTSDKKNPDGVEEFLPEDLLIHKKGLGVQNINKRGGIKSV